MVKISAAVLRYQAALDRNRVLRARNVALAHRHRRYGIGMIYLNLRPSRARGLPRTLGRDNGAWSPLGSRPMRY